MDITLTVRVTLASPGNRNEIAAILKDRIKGDLLFDSELERLTDPDYIVAIVEDVEVTAE